VCVCVNKMFQAVVSFYWHFTMSLKRKTRIQASYFTHRS